MLEYASILLTLDWATPTTAPTTIVRTAIAQTSARQCGYSGSKAERKTRTNAANAAAFTPVDMKPVTRGRRRPFVGIGRPHVKGDRRDLEREPDEQQSHRQLLHRCRRHRLLGHHAA